MTTTPVAVDRRRTLTPIQRTLFASQQRDPRSPMQNMVHLGHIADRIDPDRLAAAFATVVAMSDVLRTQISTTADGETVVRLSDEPATTEIVDVPREQAHAWARRRAGDAIALGRRAYDSVILVHEDGTVSWYLALHHCVTDAVSSTLVFEMTGTVYDGGTVEIAPYYDWPGLRAQGPAHEHAVRHWTERAPAPRIGKLYEQPRAAAPASRRVPVGLDDDLAAELEALIAGRFRSISSDLSWTTTLLTATAVHLHRVTGADRFAIGVPVHNRSRPDARSLLGPLVEVYPVDIAVEHDDTFATLQKRIGRSLNQTLRFAVPGTAPAASDVETVVNVLPRLDAATFGSHPGRVDWIHAGASDPQHLMRVQLARFGPTQLVLDLNEGAIADHHAQRAAGHYEVILRGMVADPDASIGGFSLLLPEEQVAVDSWGHGPPEPPSRLVVDRLAESLHRRDDVALVDGDLSLSGRELWSRVEALAAGLRAGGVGRGDRVAIEMDRSADAVIAIFATLVSGASYVPIDPAQPTARRVELIARAGCKLVVRDVADVPAAPVNSEPDPFAGRVSEDDEAYLLFTSGSTGEPKGVPISHRGLADYLSFAVDSYPTPNQAPVAALFSALTFDLTVTSLFVPLVCGGRTVVVRPDGPLAMAQIAATADITWCKATPSHLELLVRLLPPEHALATLVVGGEAFTASLARRIRKVLPSARIFNEYGPTEAVVGCMIHEWVDDEFPESADVPIGTPAPGVDLRVLDRYGHDVPPGAVGELHITRRGLTVGYLDGDDRAFHTDHGRRWYRSGDLVRMLDDDTLVYLRRADEQLKVGGVRVDPSEIEAALERHPAIERAAVRAWTPQHEPARHLCTRCGLADNVPGVTFDAQGICDRCHSYEAIRVQADAWFRDHDDLIAIRDQARTRRTGDYDCVALLSGGKDSTYALFQLVRMGFSVYALTLDNGFISDGAKENARRSAAALGIDHEFATADAMNEIFRDSLERHSNVCHGCFKTIYTLGTNRAVELGAPLVVTGLSRGQLFETRLIPAQFDEQRFDPDAIDAAVLAARRSYHRIDDAVRRLMDTSVFDDDDVFERISYVDFYRYVDVELAEMLRFLDEEAPWVRPADTGRSTNCRINAAGIQTHLLEQGYHNYAEPYAWDVRLGHKQRDEALAELDDRDDEAEVAAMLDAVGYTPRRRELLTAWVEVGAGATAPTPAEMRVHLQRLLPAHAVPTAFVIVDELPMTTNGKLDTAALPAPTRTHRSSPALFVAPTSPMEQAITELWERHLGVDSISIDDDFFALGGDSLAALEMTIMLSDALDVDVPEAVVFSNATPRLLAAAIGEQLSDTVERTAPRPGDGGEPPAPSAGERAMLFEHRARPDDPRYNQGRLYRLDGPVDAERLRGALAKVVERHQPLHWGFGEPRRPLGVTDALQVRHARVESWPDVEHEARELHREPFDLVNGPLVRCGVFDVDGSTGIVLVTHHISTDAGSFERLWNEIEAAYHGEELAPLAISYADHTVWQAARLTPADEAYWRESIGDTPRMQLHRPAVAEPDGLREFVSDVTADELRASSGTSPFAAVSTALAATLGRYCDADEVTFGALVSTRDHPSAEHVIGYYLNTLPLTMRLDRNERLADLRAEAAASLASALAHRTLPFADMVAERRRAGLTDPTPQVLVALQELDDVEFGQHRATQEILFTGTAVADATFFVQQRAGRVVLAIEHRGAVVNAAMADQLLRDLDAALTAVVHRADDTVGSVILPSQQASLLVGPDPAEATHVVEQIMHHMGSAPASEAVRCGERSLSWEQLDRASAALADRLIDAGVEPTDRVLVALPRSVELIVAIVGVLRAGAAYVPLDPTYPPERNRAIARASQARAAVATSPEYHDVVVSMDGLDTVDAPLESTRVDVPPIDLDAPAYEIYTSGSTGEPRGVAIDHRALATSTAARRTEYLREPGQFLVVSSPAFDSSVAGIFWSLTTGGTVVLPTESEVHDIDALVDLFASADITHTLMVPSLYRGLLARAADDAPWPDQVIVAGEACGSDIVAEHVATRASSRLSNEYGPTETTVWATVGHLNADTSDNPIGVPAGGIPIGHPIAGLWTAVIDEHGELCPAGVIGELLIGGSTVAAGYRRIASDRFDDSSPFGRGRTFRTGDRAAVWSGELHFHGRVDDQLNAGGVRVEPGEIESVLESVDGVEAAVVVARDLRSLDVRLATASTEQLAAALRQAADSDDPVAALDRSVASNAHTSLVAHVEGGDIDLDAIDARLVAALPAAARPRIVAVHERLPRLPNGKLDRAAVGELAVPVADRAGSSRTDGDPAVVDVTTFFRTVLERDDIGPDADFFDAGGQSLLALELLLMIEQRFGVRPRVSVLFEARTPRSLVATLGLGDEQASDRDDTALVLQAGTATSPPLWIWPGSDGALLIFEQLVSRLDPDLRVLGVEYPGTRGERAPFDTIEELGRHCYDILVATQPSGPYRMLGYSTGGLVAVDVARRLIASGERVEYLGAIEAGLAGVTDPRSRPAKFAEAWRTRGPRFAFERLRSSAQVITDEVAAATRRSLEERAAERFGVRPSDRKIFLDMEHHLRAASLAYRPGDVDADVVLYLGDDATEHWVNAMTRAWGAVAGGRLRVVQVAGSHIRNTMLLAPDVHSLAQHVDDEFAGA